jgi:hypothetical protein
MLKKLLFSLVVFCGAGVADAALIVSYKFTGANGTSAYTPVSGDYGSTGAVAPNPTNFSAVLTASQWRNSVTTGTANGVQGSISSNQWQTASTIVPSTDSARSNRLDIAPVSQALGSGTITIDSIKFDLARTSANSNKVFLEIQFRPNSDASYVTVGTGESNTDTTSKSNTINLATPIVFTKDSQQSNFRFLWYRGGTGTGGGRALLDNLEFHGFYTAPAVVPEPASIAVFGLLGAGVAARRFRRKA